MYGLGENYSFLERYNLVDLVISGSRAHGLENKDSDLDIRGIVFNSKEEILLGNDFEAYADKETDTVLYSLKKFMTLLRKSNMSMLEILGTRKDQILVSSGITREIRSNLDKILSKECVHSVLGFANSQARIVDKKMLVLDDKKKSKYLEGILRHSTHSFKEQYGDYGNLDITLKGSELWLTANLDMPLSNLNKMSNSINTIIKQAEKSHTESKKPPLKVMAKAQSNVIYSYMFLLDILEDRGLNTYRGGHENKILRDIKEQKYIQDNEPTSLYYDILKEYEEKVENALKVSKLREEPDINYLNELFMKETEKIIKSN